MKKLLGVILIICGVILGLYLGLYIMCVGGIVEVINGIKANPTNAWWIAKGILKFLFSGIVGWISGLIVVSMGVGLASE